MLCLIKFIFNFFHTQPGKVSVAAVLGNKLESQARSLPSGSSKTPGDRQNSQRLGLL